MTKTLTRRVANLEAAPPAGAADCQCNPPFTLLCDVGSGQLTPDSACPVCGGRPWFTVIIERIRNLPDGDPA